MYFVRFQSFLNNWFVKEKWQKEGRQRNIPSDFPPLECLQQQGQDSPVRCIKVHVGHPWAPKSLNQHLLPVRVCFNRKPEEKGQDSNQNTEQGTEHPPAAALHPMLPRVAILWHSTPCSRAGVLSSFSVHSVCKVWTHFLMDFFLSSGGTETLAAKLYTFSA